MKQLTVEASKNYQIIITDNFLDFSKYANQIIQGKKVCIITDSNVSPLYLDNVKEQLKNYEVFTYQIEAGENSKNANNYVQILNYLADNLFDRNSTIVALGGGVVGDLAGFVASTYMRGINFIQCPTSLLSQVDSSVGGKTAINLEKGKNLAGAFYQPSLVYINVNTLKTLPQCELLNGFGEVIKYAFISNTLTKEIIEKRDFEEIILESLKIKADIVKKDEFEGGIRKFLNLGHTIGHAIEKLSNYKLPHGLCVAKGIALIIKASTKFYKLTDEQQNKMLNLLNVLPFDLSIDFSLNDIIDKILIDKKVSNGKVSAVLIKEVGNVEIVSLSQKEMGDLLK